MKNILKNRSLNILFALLVVCFASACSSKKEVASDSGSFAAGDMGGEPAAEMNLGASSSGRGR